MLPVSVFPRLSLPWFLFAQIPACSLTMGTGYVAPAKAFQNKLEQEARAPCCTLLGHPIPGQPCREVSLSCCAGGSPEAQRAGLAC